MNRSTSVFANGAAFFGLMTILSAVIFAGTYSGGSGTTEDPYKISTVADWQELIATSADWDSHFVLVNDIDFEETPLTPVAPDTNTTGSFQGTPFIGVFDGQDHILRNVVINLPGQDYVGLFGFVGNGAEIGNLQVENVSVTGHDIVGGLCGWNENGLIHDCSIEGLVMGPGDSSEVFGGLCGENYGGEIAGCTAMVDLEGGKYAKNFGGLCGINTGTIRDCYANGEIIAGMAGGLCGKNDHGTILRSHAVGFVWGGSSGGLCGYNSYGAIDDCSAAGDVTGSGSGGLCGHNEYGTIRNSHATGSIRGGENLGGLIGETFAGRIEDCFAGGPVIGETGSTYLGGLCGYVSEGTISRCYAAGAVSAGVSSNYLGGLCGANGLLSQSYATIRDSYATGSVSGGSFLGGLFGYNRSGTFIACYATGDISGVECLGGLIGENNGGTIRDCYASGMINGTRGIGGFAGSNYRGKIHRCYSVGKPTGTTSVGGFCGMKTGGSGFEDTGNFWDTQTSQKATSAMGTGKTTSQMKTKTTFTGAGWDFVGETVNGTEDIWRMCGSGVNYPRLSREFSDGGDFACPNGVSMNDLSYLSVRWLADSSETAGAADGNGDGKVDLADFAILGSNWLKD